MDAEYIISVVQHIGDDEVIVLVEGEDDSSVYRLIDEDLLALGASSMPCKGRSNLLEVYKKRGQIGHSRVVYVADKDLYTLSAIPNEYSGIIWTSGYSIENDLLLGETLVNLLDVSETIIYRRGIENLCAWYTVNILSQLSLDYMKIKTHPSQIVDDEGYLLHNHRDLSAIKYSSMYNYILDNYQIILRGKIINLWIAHIISSRKSGSKYSTGNLLDIAYRFNSGAPIRQTFRKVISEVKRIKGISDE